MEKTSTFQEIVTLYSGNVYNNALRLLKNREDAEEAVQDIFMKVRRGMDDFRGDANISTWIYRITINACLSRLQSKRLAAARSEGDGSEILSAVQTNDPTPEENLIAFDVQEKLMDGIRGLESDLGVPLMLFYFDELGYEEIATVLQLPIGTVCTRIARGRVALRRQLGPILKELRSTRK